MVGDLPDADIAPPENVLFVCKLNPVTTDDDLEIIFSRWNSSIFFSFRGSVTFSYGSGSRLLMTKICKIFTAKKIIFFWNKATIYLFLCLQKGRPKLRKNASALQRKHPALQNMKFLNFFLLLRVIFALLDSDPDSEYGSETLVWDIGCIKGARYCTGTVLVPYIGTEPSYGMFLLASCSTLSKYLGSH